MLIRWGPSQSVSVALGDGFFFSVSIGFHTRIGGDMVALACCMSPGSLVKSYIHKSGSALGGVTREKRDAAPLDGEQLKNDQCSHASFA